jgi:hypothetical protein
MTQVQLFGFGFGMLSALKRSSLFSKDFLNLFPRKRDSKIEMRSSLATSDTRQGNLERKKMKQN